jgi:hypothetical protein
MVHHSRILCAVARFYCVLQRSDYAIIPLFQMERHSIVCCIRCYCVRQGVNYSFVCSIWVSSIYLDNILQIYGSSLDSSQINRLVLSRFIKLVHVLSISLNKVSLSFVNRLHMVKIEIHPPPPRRALSTSFLFRGFTFISSSFNCQVMRVNS